MKTQLKTVVFLLGLQLSYAQFDLIPKIESFGYDATDCHLEVTYKIQNVGSDEAPAFSYALLIGNLDNEVELFSTTVQSGALAANSSTDVQGWSIDLNALSGYQPNTPYKFYILVDPDEDLIEFNDENNIIESAQVSCGKFVTSIDEQMPVLFSVAPNPSSGLFNIKTDVLDGEYTLSVQNLFGQTVVNKVPGTLVDLTSQPKGMYLLVLETKTSKQVQKIEVN